jgi:hypothetical protein
MKNDWNVFREQAIAGGTFIEIERTATPQHGNPRHRDVHTRGIELDPGTAGGCENAAPVGIAPCERRLDEWRSGNRFRDALGRCFRLCATDFDFDHPLRALSVRDYLQSQ